MAFKSPNWQKQGIWNQSFYYNPYTYTYNPGQEWVDSIKDALQAKPAMPEPKEDRSLMNRLFSPVLAVNYASAGSINNLIDKNPNTTFFGGIRDGLKAGNPFGDGFKHGEVTYSDVLDTAGWKPESTLGKIAKGTVGFGLDVLLDPTTYLTGGTSAIIKGTGRVGKTAEALGKLGGDVARASADNLFDDLIKQGMEKNVARKYVDDGLAKGAFNIADDVTSMTPDMAREIVTKQFRENGVTKTSDEITESATKLADEYNRVMGIRDAKGAGDVTFGLGNLPFAPKSWEKFNIKLGSQAPLQKLSDKLQISKGYAGLRSAIYGSQIGKMFSTTSPMWRLANDNPAKLWEALEYVAHTRGQKLDKLQAEKEIRQRFKSLGLSEAENKEVLSLLQDKTVWNKIAEKAKFKDLAKVQEIKDELILTRETATKQLEVLKQKQEIAKTWKDALDKEIVSEKDFLDIMNTEFRQDLINLDLGHIASKNQLDEAVKMIQREIEDLETLTTDEGALRKLHELSIGERQAMDEHMQGKLDLPDTKDLKVKRESKEVNAMGEVIKKADSAPGRENTFQLKEALSSFLYGHNNSFRTTSDDGLDGLMDILNKGGTKEEMLEFVERNPNLFDPHFQAVNSYVATELGYKAWGKDGMKHPLMKILGMDIKKSDDYTINQLNALVTEKLHAGELSESQMAEFGRLLQLDMTRTVMRRQFMAMKPEDFHTYKRELENERLMKEVFDQDDEWLELNRSHWIDDASANKARGQVYRPDYKELHHLTEEHKPEVIQHIIQAGIFTREAVENANGTFVGYINRIVDEVDNLSINQFGKSYLDLTDKQKKLALKLSADNVAKGSRGLDPKLVKKAQEVATKRVAEEAEHLAKVDPGAKGLSPEEILMRNDTVLNDLARKEVLIKELQQAQDEIISFEGRAFDQRKDALNFYNQRIKEQESVILELETKQKDFIKMLDEASDDNIELVAKQIDEIEDLLATDDALETWMRMSNQTDLELLKDPQRYSRLNREDMPANELGWTGARGITLNKNIDKRVFYDALKKRAVKLYGGDYTYEQLTKIINTPEKMERFVAEHEFSHLRNKDWEKRDRKKGDLNDPKTAEIEKRADYDAIDMLKNFDVDKMLADAMPVDAGRIWLDTMASSDKVAKTVRTLRALFDEMGQKEVEAGRLSEEAFEAMVGQYVPHILTPDGKEYFAKLKELSDHGTKVTHDMGYGVVYNPHAQSRTIQGKTIEEINEYFRDKLQGKNLFSENIADIYLARAMKHNELMYDEKYMTTMLKTFGKEIPLDGKILDGYKAVMNHGMLKRTSSDIASMNLSAHISDDVTTWLERNYASFADMATKSGRNVQDFVSAQIDQYLKDKYPDKVLSEMWDGFHKSSFHDTKLSDEILGREGMPMVEMGEEQIIGIRNAWNVAYDNQLRVLNRSMEGAMNRGDMERVAEITKRMEAFAKRTPPQIRQVNDTIVQKANQARMLQRAKDQNRFLQMYDRFLHFMKLNQTVVTPAFHGRNKLSNIYLNWLAVGNDAFNKDMQIATTALAKLGRNEGDMTSIPDIISGKKFGHKQLSKPLIVDNPHPELVDALDMTNGVLHWEDLWELAVRYDVIDNGAFAQDIGAGASTKGLFPGLKRTRKDGTVQNLDPTDTANFALYKAGTKIGTVVENGDRLLHFASMLKQGKSIEEASRSSKQFLFDYSDLTAFEQGVMKRIMPYYTWLRKNARLQVSQLIENPEKFRTVAKVMTGIEHMTPEDERVNKAYFGEWADGWLQLPFNITNSKGKEEAVLFNPAMPFMDLNRIPDPTQIDNSLRGLFAQTSPLPKVILEQIANKNAFLNSEIVSENGNQFTGRLNHVMSQFALYNYGSGFFTRDNVADVGLHALATGTGIKANSIDPDMARNMYYANGGNHAPIDEAVGRLADSVTGGMVGFVDHLIDNTSEGIKKGVLSLTGQPPTDPSDYTGALKPISAETYNELPNEEKVKYTAPTKEKAYYYHTKAVEQAEKATREAGAVKNFIWGLFDTKGEDFTVARVSSVSDGDTFKITSNGKESEVRLLLVDTPETVDPRKPAMPVGKEASNYSKSMLMGKDVKLIFDQNEVDGYGRTLAYVEIDGKDFGKQLVEQGLGTVRYTDRSINGGRGKYSRADEYFDVEREASKTGQGIWEQPGYATPGVDKGYNLNAVGLGFEQDQMKLMEAVRRYQEYMGKR